MCVYRRDLIESLSFDIFHDEIRRAVRSDGRIVEPGDIGMVQAGQDSLFVTKPVNETAQNKSLPNEFNGNAPSQLNMVREVDFTHASFADKRYYLVVAERFSGSKRGDSFDFVVSEKLFGISVNGRPLNEIPRLFVAAQERLHLCPKFRTITACLIEISGTALGSLVQRRLHQLLD